MANLLETLFEALGLFLESIGISRPAKKSKPSPKPASKPQNVKL
jgi:hypothetical protein